MGFNTFEDAHEATIGMDFQSKTVHLTDRQVRLQLWDTAGQERFRSLIPSYIRDAAAAVVVYDITRRASFAGTRKWIEDVRSERGSDALVALVGNKSDLADKREVPTEDAKQQAQEMGVMFTETSAKEGINVNELFQQLAANLPTVNGNRSQPEGGGTGAKSQGAAADDRSQKIELGKAPKASKDKTCKC